MKKRVLLCPPKYYDIEYVINPWMNLENKVDFEKANDEYNQLKKTFEDLGAEVLEIIPAPGLPDMVYTANAGFPSGNRFIKSNFRFQQRIKEADLARSFFEKMDFKILTIPDNIYFEGQGDLLTVGGKYFFGYGKRSSVEAKDFLSQMLGTKVITFELNDPYYYHLDMSLGLLDEKTAIVNTRSFTREGMLRLRNEIPNVIEASEHDNDVMACNLVVIGKTVVLGKGISEDLKKKIKKAGFDLREVSMEEYRKGGGSVKCCTLEFF